MDCLKSLDADYIRRNLDNITANPYYRWGPMHGDQLNPLDLPTALSKKKMKVKNLLIGVVVDEGTSILSLYTDKDLQLKPRNGRKISKKDALKKLNFFLVDQQLVNQLFGFYFDRISDHNSTGIRKGLDNILDDATVTCNTVLYALKYANSCKSNVYFYKLIYPPKTSFFKPCDDSDYFTKPCHIDDLLFLFGDPFRNRTIYSEEDRKFSTQIMKIWGHFSRTGEAVTSGGTEWPEIKKHSDDVVYMDLSPSNYTLQHDQHPQCSSLWLPLFLKASKLAKN